MSRQSFAKFIAVVAVTIILYPPNARAQDTATVTPHRYCWRGKQKPACDAFLLTEFGFFVSTVQPTLEVENTLEPTHTIRDPRWNLTWEVGMLVNATARDAHGLTLLLGGNRGGGTVGVKARYRRWLTPGGQALDLGAGLRTSQFTTDDFEKPSTSPTFTADIAINDRDYIALVARIDLTQFAGRYQPYLALGVRAGSRPAAIGTGAFVVIGAALVALFVFTYNGK